MIQTRCVFGVRGRVIRMVMNATVCAGAQNSGLLLDAYRGGQRSNPDMARTPRRTVTEQLALPPVQTAARPISPATGTDGGTLKEVAPLVEFDCGGEPWRCARFDLLTAEFEVSAAQLPAFWAAAASKPRSLLIARRLYGAMPVIPSPTLGGDDLRVWGREELQSALGLTRAQLQAELDALRGHWVGSQSPGVAVGAAAETNGSAPKTQTDAAAKGELGLYEDDAYLASLDYAGMPFADLEERRWFVARAREWEKLLRERMTKGVAREALFNEVLLRRVEHQINLRSGETVGQPEWTRLVKTKQELQESYGRQIDRIQELAPWASQIAGKYALQGMLSDLTAAMQDYHARGDTTKVDGINTALEIEVLCRRSQQVPEPQYRAGHIVYLNSAKAGMWDPNWTGTMPMALIRKINSAWTEAFVAASAADGEQPIDLEAEGPEGEYPEPGAGKEAI